VLATVVVLLVVVLEAALRDRDSPSGYSLNNFVELYTSSFLQGVIGNTVLFAVISTGTALLFAVPTALLVQRTTQPLKGVVMGLMLVTALVPGYVTAQAWLLMFHPRIGLMNRWWVETLGPGTDAPFNIINVPAMGVINGLGLSSVAFFMLAGVFRSVDPALEESAQIHGLGALARIRKIILPLAFPGTLAVIIFVTMLSLASVDIPRVIGLSRTIFLFSTAISGEFPRAIQAASTLFILLGLGMSWWYFRVIRNAHRYAVVTGRGYKLKAMSLSGPQATGAWAFIAFFSFLSAGLPLLALLWISVTPYFVAPSIEALGRLTLSHYADISLDGRFWEAARNTVGLLIIVPTATVFFSLLISWTVVRTQLRFRGAMDAVAFLPHAVPSVLFATAAVHVSLYWAPAIYRTFYVVILVLVITRISFPTRILNSGLIQIHKELDEAGYASGLGAVTVLRKILFPLLWTPLTYAWLWVALVTYREAALMSLLRTPIPSLAGYVSGQGGSNGGAAMTVFLLTVVIGLALGLLAWSRRRFDLAY